MGLKLYRVEFTFDVMVLAENESVARNSGEDALADRTIPTKATVMEVQAERDIPLGHRRIVPEMSSRAEEISLRIGKEKTVCVEWVDWILDNEEREKTQGEADLHTLPLFPKQP